MTSAVTPITIITAAAPSTSHSCRWETGAAPLPDPVMLRHYPSLEVAHAKLERRVIILVSIVNGLLVLLPLLLDIRRIAHETLPRVRGSRRRPSR